MSKYTVIWCEGDYPDRQAVANKAQCVAYVEHHFNALLYDKEGIGDNPALCVVAHNASETSKQWARVYTELVSKKFGFRNGGVLQRKFKERGDYNLRFTDMPAILVEPLFVSEIEQATIALSEKGQQELAEILVSSIVKMFPGGGKFGFSIGHLGKESTPYDRGAPVVPLGSNIAEADLAKAVMLKAAKLLEAVGDDATPIGGCKIACPNCGVELKLGLI